MASIFIKQLYSILINNGVKNKFNFILDNFDSISNIFELSDMLSAGISRNIKFSIITRSKNLLEEKYGSYINYLSDSIHVNESTIELNVGGTKESIDNNVAESNQSEVSIDYPTMNNVNIVLFDWKKYVDEKVGPSIQDFSKNPFESSSNLNIDEMVKTIDEKNFLYKKVS